jgi:MoxR-like ATPase
MPTIFIDENGAERKAMAILRVNGNLRLIGETGVGKSTIVQFLSEKHKWDLYDYALSTDTSRWDLLAQDILQSDGKGGVSTMQRKGRILEWLTSTKNTTGDKSRYQVLFLDELNYAQPGVLTILNMLGDFRKKVYISELESSKLLKDLKMDEPVFKRTDKHWMIVGMNPAERAGYSGTFTMNIAQLRRFESLELTYLSQQQESRLLETQTKCSHEQAMKYVAMAGQTRALYRVGRLATPITTGNLLNYARLEVLERLSDTEISEIMTAMYPQNEHDTVVGLWKGKVTAESVMKDEELMQD